MPSDHKCSKCNSNMEAGLVVDLNYAGVLPSMWIESQHGVSSVPGAQPDGRKKVKTITYRCLNCGYLDSYAK